MRCALLLIVSIVLMPLNVSAAPKAQLWSKWTTHDPASTTNIDHEPWDAFLARTVSLSPDGINRVAYARVTPDDEELLQSYIQSLSEVAVSKINRFEQRAYWINFYNALTLKVVLDNYPVSTIRKINISPGFFASGPWGRKLIDVEGERVSLDDIEHRILRPIWKDARLHYALNCASVGCPSLQANAFTAANSEMLLDRGAVDYVNHPRGVDIRDQRLIVSSIYIWFMDDFGGNDQGVIDHLKKFARPALKSSLENITTIADDVYDWSLNE
ncbi:MAG: DUF547 domain-containing protein [Rhodospirillales bacterium]|nr:DUF547 domain-containing protein [Rhodospirillales bacterium]